LTVRDVMIEMLLDAEPTPDGDEVVAAMTARTDLAACGIAPPFGIVRPEIALELRAVSFPRSTQPAEEPAEEFDGCGAVIEKFGFRHRMHRHRRGARPGRRARGW